MARTNWRFLLVPTCLLTATILFGCSDLTGPGETVSPARDCQGCFRPPRGGTIPGGLRGPEPPLWGDIYKR